MQIIELQEQIEILRNRLINEDENYRAAIQKNMDLELVRLLYNKLKSIASELKHSMAEYEKIITGEMARYDKLKHPK